MSYLADGALGVNDEETTESDTLLLNEDTVILGDLVVLVGEEGDVHTTETTVLACGTRPRKEGVLGVDRREDDLRVALLELLSSVGEGNDLGRAVVTQCQLLRFVRW